MAENNTATERPAGPPTAADLRADADRLSEIAGLMRSSAALIGALTAERDRLNDALSRSPFDISPCLGCGKPVVCYPDGMPSCDPCAESGKL